MIGFIVLFQARKFTKTEIRLGGVNREAAVLEGWECLNSGKTKDCTVFGMYWEALNCVFKAISELNLTVFINT